MKHTVFMQFERETKGAVRYQEIDPKTGVVRKDDSNGALMGTQYFRKATFGTDNPARIKVVVESA